MVAREPMVVCGLSIAIAVFQQVSNQIQCSPDAAEGEDVDPGRVLLKVQGPARAILTAERVALNFVQRLSGVATLTRRFVKAIEGTKAQILDTRKTTPGLRLLEKYAVTSAG